MDGKTKDTLCEFWIKGGDNEELIDDVVSSDDEWEESDNISHLNPKSNPFFKPYFDAQEGKNIYTFENGRGYLEKRKSMIYGRDVSKLDEPSVSDDRTYELLDEGVCKSKKFKVTRYSLGASKEYIAIITCECKT
nr:hypothetical protein [Tanacetum cinerariifolium]